MIKSILNLILIFFFIKCANKHDIKNNDTNKNDKKSYWRNWIEKCKSDQNRWNKEHRSIYEVAKKEDSNFEIEIYQIYNGEKVSILLNDILIFSFIGDSTNSSIGNFSKDLCGYSKMFYFPDTIKTVEVISEYKNKTFIKNMYKNTLEFPKIYLFISSPIPDTMNTIPKDIYYKPNWNYIPIDKSKRIVKIYPDTMKIFNLD